MPSERRQSLAWVTLVGAILVAAAIGTGVAGIESEDVRLSAYRAEELRCLAENVYYEARGEPLAGQFAVAEVTMNRVRSATFPDSVCAVVHQSGAFSWTYQDNPPKPFGYEWVRAQSVARAVYDDEKAPVLAGALYYHATHVSPDWAGSRSRVARIGRHLFYL